MAIEVVRQRKVYHVLKAGSFVVEGSNGDKYSVQLYLKESCPCPSLATSHYILAVQMSIGVEELSEKRIYNLTQLRKNTRKRPNKRAGRKRPRRVIGTFPLFQLQTQHLKLRLCVQCRKPTSHHNL
jgi:hypothetical protein